MSLQEVLGNELWDQVSARISEVNAAQPDKTKHVRLVDLSEGGYVNKDKFDAKVNGLSQQVSDLQGQISQRDTDIANLQTQLSSNADAAGQLTSAQEALTNLQTKYNDEKVLWEQKNAQQAYDFAIRERANALKFSSNAAKKEFIREAIAAKFTQDGETLVGYNDFVESYKKNDPTAFAAEESPKEPQGGEPPVIVLPAGKGGDPAEKSIFGFNFGGVRPRDIE